MANDEHKNYLFLPQERVGIINNSLFKDLNINNRKVKVFSFNTLTTTFCKKYKANIIFRGLRAVSDFEYEFQLAGMNRTLDKGIETVFLMSDVEHQVISSNLVKEIAALGGDVTKFVTKSVVSAIREKI